MSKPDKKSNFKNKLIFFFGYLGIIAISIVGIVGMLGIFVDTLQDFMETNVSTLLSYAGISLTLFGITYLGATFQIGKKNESIKNIYIINILFLSSAIGFFNTYWTLKILILGECSFPIQCVVIKGLAAFSAITWVIGIAGLIYGLILLLRMLIGIYNKNLS